jgi:hypothetical protein
MNYYEKITIAAGGLIILVALCAYLRAKHGKTMIIYGCEATGDKDSPYLTRHTLIERKRWQLLIHRFHRSDKDDLHDHPWWYVSIILWRGYVEETFDKKVMIVGRHRKRNKKRVWPGQILFRSAHHAHRVELVDGKPAVTLVLTGQKKWKWGFYTRHGYRYWRDYFEDQGC